MGAVRWTAKGLKIVGDILDSEDAEKWLLEKGKNLLERELTDLRAKWFFGRTRAKQNAKSTILDSINDDKDLRAAIESHLAVLPSMLENIARDIWVSSASVSDQHFVVAACPREIVVRRYTKQIVDKLKGSVSLNKYNELPEQFLTRVAADSEAAYFSQDSFDGIGPMGRVVGTNTKFDWNLGSISGHYYVGFLFLKGKGEDLSQKKKAREFKEFAMKAVEQLNIQLGSLTESTRDELQAKVRKIA